MIYSREHGLIFLKARKVAGTSFEIALSRYLSDRDVITPVSRKDEAIRRRLGFTGAHNFNFGFARFLGGADNPQPRLLGIKMPLKYYNHIPAAIARRRLGEAAWKASLKTAIVRNPWDRAVSLYFYRNQTTGDKIGIDGFTEFVKANDKLLTTNYRNYMIGGKDVIDLYIRYEHFEEDVRGLEARIPSLSGLWDTLQGINAKGSTRDRSLTTAQIFAAHPEADARIRSLNAWEIAKFGYAL